MYKKALYHVKRGLKDPRPYLPLDPDSERFKIATPIHTDGAHIGVVALGAFFGTLARYDLDILIPSAKDGWPTAVFLINISGSFVLGFLLQALLRHGKDFGGRRVLRLLLGTGFLGAFTTYSSLATAVALLAINGSPHLAVSYGVASLVVGTLAAGLGIRIAALAPGVKR